jgi:hypothetical protein
MTLFLLYAFVFSLLNGITLPVIIYAVKKYILRRESKINFLIVISVTSLLFLACLFFILGMEKI